MSARVAAASVAVTALVVLTVWLTDLSFERAALLAPALVIGVAAATGLAVFWGKVGLESLRNANNPRLIVLLAAAFVVLLAVLTLLGIELPRE